MSLPMDQTHASASRKDAYGTGNFCFNETQADVAKGGPSMNRAS